MAVRVVVRLEVIDVEHGHAVPVRVTLNPRLQEIEILFEGTTVAETGERILAGERDQLGVQHTQCLGRRLNLAGLRGQRLGLQEEVREHRDLRTQLVGWHRREDEVDRALRVEIGGDDLVAAVRGDEDDRRQLRLLTLADERGGLESVHDRHAHVEQDDREVLRHETPQRAETGVGFDDRCARAVAGPPCSARRLAALSSTTRTGTLPRLDDLRRLVGLGVDRRRRSLRRGMTHGLRGRGRGRQPRPDRGDQLVGVHRLGDVVVGARRRGSVGVRRARPCPSPR